MKTTHTLAIIASGFALCANVPHAQSSPDRTVLPIKEPLRDTTGTLDVRNATAPPRFEVKAPEGAPNVLLVLIDDLGFAGTSAFGGPVPTPHFDRIAAGGLKYNNFHTTAVCSPTRTALKSGRNHHVNNMGGIIETDTAFPGNTDETADVGVDLATPVAEAIGAERKSKFTGRIPKLIVEVK